MKSLLIVGGALEGGLGLGGSIVQFGTTGIVTGNVAAATQTAIVNVAAGSVFVTMTSLGMSDTFVATAIGGAETASIGTIAKSLV
jgi:hypothetical protein